MCFDFAKEVKEAWFNTLGTPKETWLTVDGKVGTIVFRTEQIVYLNRPGELLIENNYFYGGNQIFIHSIIGISGSRGWVLDKEVDSIEELPLVWKAWVDGIFR